MIILKDELLSGHTSMGVGGKAKSFILPQNLGELINILKVSNNFFLLGNGTNTICTDKDINKDIICTKRVSQIEKEGDLISCECGVNAFALHDYLLKNSLGGFEWAYGIPGSIGAMAYMNAGAYGKEMSGVVKKILVLHDGKEYVLSRQEIPFAYRSCGLKNIIILKVWFEFYQDSKENIKNNQLTYITKRKSTQPYGEKSAGSVYKRKNDFIPSQVLDKLGLKGAKIGQAQVSTKHAGFIVNLGGASFEDIFSLMQKIEKFVLEKTGEKLEREVVLLE